MLYLSNAFSISMLGQMPQEGRTVKVRPISVDEVREVLQSAPFTSAVGHSSTAEVISLLVGVEVPANRVAISLSPGDKLVVFQLGTRLQEGQVLSKEEVESLYQQGLASFALVEVLP